MIELRKRLKQCGRLPGKRGKRKLTHYRHCALHFPPAYPKIFIVIKLVAYSPS